MASPAVREGGSKIASKYETLVENSTAMLVEMSVLYSICTSLVVVKSLCLITR